MLLQIVRTSFFCIVFSCLMLRSNAQSFELQQLAFNIEKLNQLKAILQQLKDGYEILTKGYNTIRDLSEGNFSLHKTFLDGLLAVSPTVKKYKRVGEIIIMQKDLISKSKKALSDFTASDVFNADEISYLQKVYDNLIDRSLKNMDELLMVITANKLRMNDAERLSAIDRIYEEMTDKINFLKHFNSRSSLLGAQRKKELQDNQMLQKLYFK